MRCTPLDVPGHEDAEWIVPVLAEGSAASEPGALVEAQRGTKAGDEPVSSQRLVRPRTLASAIRWSRIAQPIPCPRKTSATRYRLQLARRSSSSLSAPQPAILPDPRRPEGDARLAELVQVEGVDALRRRVGMHSADAGRSARESVPRKVVENEADRRQATLTVASKTRPGA